MTPSRECPLCGWTGSRFLPYGINRSRRPEARCPGCGSLERHRFVAAAIADRLGTGHTTLHVAPEGAISSLLRSRSVEYLSIDLEPGQAMVQADLTDLHFDDGRFSLIFCSHVLEHIPDDVRALREMHRVLAPSGLLVLMVPIEGAVTDEDLSVVDEAERLRRYGHPDHVRSYGSDVLGRVRACGFDVEVIRAGQVADADRIRFRLLPSEPIFLATRGAAQPSESNSSGASHSAISSAPYGSGGAP